jgi:DNA-binding NtrC family response regulator
MDNTNLTGLSLLVVEDDPMLRRQVTAVMERLGADVTAVGDLGAARRSASGLDFDFVLLDLHLPDGLGLDLLREKCFATATGVIVMTASSEVQHAVQAMRLGALDYVGKPLNPAELPLVIARARRARQSTRQEEHRRQASGAQEFFFGDSLAGLRDQLDRILAADVRVEGTPSPVLIEGETGTGKTTIARWLHEHGPRSAQTLVEVNCSALPDTLAESELFGHERGAFTDARSTRIGLFEAASGGTLFLDELPSLPAPIQAKVLTAIEDHRIRRIGGRKPIEIDTRIVAATNRDLRRLVAEGGFREDLLHRLDLFRLRLPPLRERGGDLVRIAGMLVGRLCRRHRTSLRSLSDLGRRRLLAHPWPGNVRELAHELERALVFEDGETLDFKHLATDPAAREVQPQDLVDDDWFNTRYVFPNQGFDLEQAVLRVIDHALLQTAGNMSAAARILGVPRDYLRYRLDKRVEAAAAAGSEEDCAG